MDAHICINIIPPWIYQISKSVTEIDVFVIRFLTGSTKSFLLLQKHLESTRLCLCFLLAAVGWSKVNTPFGSTLSLFRLDRCCALLLCSTLRKLRRPYLDIAITSDRFRLIMAEHNKSMFANTGFSRVEHIVMRRRRWNIYIYICFRPYI